MSVEYFWVSVVIMGAVTFLLRALPFFIPKKYLDNHYIRALARGMPLMVMVILVAHSLKQAEWGGLNSNGSIMIVCIAITATFQWYMKTPIFSIIFGSALYIFLINM